MNIIFLMVILGIGLLLMVVLFMLLKSDKKNTKQNVYIQTSGSKINISDLQFPKNIEQMKGATLSQASKTILDSYRALDYSKKLPSAMDRLEWHSWQVSILLKAVKSENTILTTEMNKIFHSLILELSNENKEQELQKIFRKYSDRVNIEKDRDSLSKDVIWTAREVSMLLFEILKSK